jgi:hypothetical protein
MKLHEEMETIAYEIWEKSGRVHGRDLEHWFEAERIVKERYLMETGEKKKPQEEKKTGKSGKKDVKTQKRKKSEDS